MSSMTDKNKMAITQRIKFGIARGTNKVLRKGKEHLIDSMQQLEREEQNFSKKKHYVRNLSTRFDKYCQKFSAFTKSIATFENGISDNTILEDDIKSMEEFDYTSSALRKNGDAYLGEAKRVINETLEKMRKVKNTHQDYLTAKKSYEKCKEDKMVKSKSIVDAYQDSFEKLLRQVNEEIPDNYEIVARSLEGFFREYATSKREFLEMELKSTIEFCSKQGITADTDTQQSSYQNIPSGNPSHYEDGYSHNETGTACIANLAKDTSSSGSNTPTSNHKNSSKIPAQTMKNVNGKSSEIREATKKNISNIDKQKATALYVYAPDESDELALAVGDEIEILEWNTDEPEPGWLYGKNMRTEETGIFPVNYVQRD